MKPYTSTVKPVQHVVHNNCSSASSPPQKKLLKLSGAILRHQSNLSPQSNPPKTLTATLRISTDDSGSGKRGGRDYMVTTFYKNLKNRLSPVNPNRRTSLDLLSWDDCRSDSPWHLAPGHNAPPPSPALDIWRFERFFVGYVRHTE